MKPQKTYEQFVDEAKLERKAIQESNLVNRIITYFDKQNYELINYFITDEFQSSPYDIIFTFNERYLNSYLRVYVEVKMRYDEYNDYFLEHKKWNSLNQTANGYGDNYLLLYVNYTPNGSFLWSINDPTKFNSKKIKCNNKTSSKINKIKKINKKQYLLPKEEGIDLQYQYPFDMKTIKLNQKINIQSNNEIPELDPEVEEWLTSKKEKYNFYFESRKIDEL